MNTTDYDDDGFVYIPKWMYRLDLTLSETAAYGIIYVFSQERQGCFFGSLDYLARYCRVSRRHAIRILQKLEAAGLIIRESHPGSTTHFFAVDKREALKLHPCQNITRDNMSPHPCQNITPTRDNSSPDNKVVDNKRDNKDIQSSPRTREDLTSYGEYVRMTAENYARLVARFGTADAARLCEILDAYLTKKPNAYRDHYRAALGWPVQRLQEEKLNEQRLKNAQEAAQRVSAQQAPVTHYADLAEIDARRKAIEDKYSAIYNAKKNN